MNFLYSEDGKNVYIQFAELEKDTDLSDEEEGMVRSMIVKEQYEKELDAIVKKLGSMTRAGGENGKEKNREYKNIQPDTGMRLYSYLCF